ncbi:MAG: hypothetical protein IJX38_02700 [Clostridia bacterium]|nr:hypothetical protein [Clostridia bacterium]
MKDHCYFVQDDKGFKELLDECYFHPSRKYASEEIKFIARNAMLLLWDMDGIVVHGIHFSKSDVRYRMLNEMSCDDLDRAIAEASAKNWNMKFVDFLVMILWHVLYGERFVEIQIEQSRSRDSA